MKIAYVFAGQGSQYTGMGRELYESNETAKKQLDYYNHYFPMKELVFGSNQHKVNDTQNAQPSIVGISLMIASTLKERGIKPSGVCGLSLGEFSALCFAGVIANENIIPIVSERGRLMSQAFTTSEVGMIALLGGKIEDVEKTVQEYRGEGVLEIANYNAPGQVVITGEQKAFVEIAPNLKECGVRKQIPLVVSGAFHSTLLQKEANLFEEYLKQYHFQEPKIDVYFNVSATKTCSDVIANMKQQMISSVCFQQTIEQMITDGYTHFIEIGPGSVLQGFIKKIDKSVYVDSVNDNESLERVIQQLEEGNE